jgi:hypothetical protein
MVDFQSRGTYLGSRPYVPLCLVECKLRSDKIKIMINWVGNADSVFVFDLGLIFRLLTLSQYPFM